MRFIRLISHGPHHAFFNMALDEAISEAVREKLSPPTLRLYQWDRPSLSIGYFQKTSDINTDYCRMKEYPLVRRLTGGRAILHDEELTYSFSSSADSSPFQGSLLDNYSIISNALLSGLRQIGLHAESSFQRKRNAGHKNPACFKAVSYGEITAGGKKIVGSAQKRYRDGFMQHGSILLCFNAKALSSVLMQSSTDDFREIGSVSTYMRDVSVTDLRTAIKEAFERDLRVKVISDNPTKYELTLAGKLETEKYATREWNFRR